MTKWKYNKYHCKIDIKCKFVFIVKWIKANKHSFLDFLNNIFSAYFMFSPLLVFITDS